MHPHRPPDIQAALPQRRHRKMLKDGSSEVWPQDAEDIFLDGLREYWGSPWANFSRGRSRWRNQYLVDYLKKHGIERSKKQVASHIQVLRNMWKGHPEFTLVAGPEEMSENSSASDRHSPSRRSSHISASSRSSSRRRHSISHSSPPSTPSSFDADFPDSKAQHRPPSLNLASLGQIQIKNEHHTPHNSLFDHSNLPVVPEMHGDMEHPFMANRVAGLWLWAEGMETKYTDVDTLPFAPNSPTSPMSPSPGGVVRTSLRMKLQMPADGYGSSAVGFNGALCFAAPLPPSAELMTRVHVDNVCISREVSALGCMERNTNSAGQELPVAMLPDSWLTRCRWLDTGNKKAIVTQEVVVDAEPIFIVIYDLQRVPGALPSAELVFWHKHVDNAPPQAPPALLPLPMTPPSANRYGSNMANSYLYSTAASVAGGHAQSMQQQPQQHHPQSPHAQQPSRSNQTTPTHTSFPQLVSPPPSAGVGPPSSGLPPQSGSSTTRSCVGYGQGGVGMGMATGVGMMGHNNTIGFNSDPWTTSLLPLF